MNISKKSLLCGLLISSFSSVIFSTLPALPTLPPSPISTPSLPSITLPSITLPTVTLPTTADIQQTINNQHLPTVTPPGLTGSAGNGLPTITPTTVNVEPIHLPVNLGSNNPVAASAQIMPISTSSVHVPTPQETFHALVPVFDLQINSFPSINENNIDNINTQSLHILDATTPSTILSSNQGVDTLTNAIVQGPTITGPVTTITGPEFTPFPTIIDQHSVAQLEVTTPLQQNSITL